MVIPDLKPSLSTKSNINTIKFLCSYGGKIVPRYPDGKLRYHGGHTRVLAVNRSVSFSELLLKMGELCGTSVSLRCQLPTEDLDALVSVKSDEDLVNLIEEYDRVSSSSSAMKVRAFLSTIGSPKATTSSLSPQSSMKSLTPKSLSPSTSLSAAESSPKFSTVESSPRFSAAEASPRFVPPVMAYPVYYPKPANRNCLHCCRNSSHVYLIHNGNHWQ
ncbi:Pre-mRNA-processing ATP-dependent RNA helicase PRP5 [Bienertia sinuspersici]